MRFTQPLPTAPTTTSTTSTPTPQITASPHSTHCQAAAAKPPISAAKRQWAYRQRSRRAATQAIGNEAIASRVSLLSLLGLCLVSLDDETATRSHPGSRNSARRVINELVTRYDIEIED